MGNTTVGGVLLPGCKPLPGFVDGSSALSHCGSHRPPLVSWELTASLNEIPGANAQPERAAQTHNKLAALKFKLKNFTNDITLINKRDDFLR